MTYTSILVFDINALHKLRFIFFQEFCSFTDGLADAAMRVEP